MWCLYVLASKCNPATHYSYSPTRELTSYYFAIPPPALHGALARFSSQFRAPLCLADAMTRELQAIHSEYNEGASQDYERFEMAL